MNTKKNSLVITHSQLLEEWADEKDPSAFTYGSHYKAQWKCLKCSYQWIATIKSRTITKNGCSCCSGRVIVKGVNDLTTLYPDVAKEWSDKNDLKAHEVPTRSNKKYDWKCSVCKYIYTASTYHRTQSRSGCPYCANRKLRKGVNDLKTLRPELAEQWNSKHKTPDEVSVHSHFMTEWKCGDCGYEWRLRVQDRASAGYDCPACDKVVSVKGVSDAKTLYPLLALEWNDKNDMINYRPTSHYRAEWICQECQYEWGATIRDRALNGHGCSRCLGKVVTVGKNDLATTHPHLIKEWNDEREIIEFSFGSGYYARWKCEEGHEWETNVQMRAVRGYGCKRCSKNISKPEQELHDYIILMLAGEHEVKQSDRSLISPKELDILIPSLGIAFEFNGDYWHSEDVIQQAYGISAHQYHESKLVAAREKGVALYFVWEHDWLNCQNEIKQAIVGVLNDDSANGDVDVAVLGKLSQD